MKNFYTLMIGILLLLSFPFSALAKEEKNQPPSEIQAVRLTKSDLPGYTFLSSGRRGSSYFDPNGQSSYRPYQYGIDWVTREESWSKLGKLKENELIALMKLPSREQRNEIARRGRNELSIIYVVMKTAKMAKETLNNIAEGGWVVFGGPQLSPLKDNLIGDETYKASWMLPIPASIVFRKGRVIILINRYLSPPVPMKETDRANFPTFKDCENDCKNYAQLILSRTKAAHLDQ